MSFARRLLLGRLLTRSGDQAWDFAVPLVLLKILPGELRVAALYYFLLRLALVIFLPRLTSLIDRVDRFRAARLGIFLQLVGVLLGLGAVWSIAALKVSEVGFWRIDMILAFAVLVAGGICSSLGSNFMDISIANDLVPSSFDPTRLASFNSRLRQIDLLTEVTAPVAAGLLLAIGSPNIPLFGFLLVGLWNVLSFVPEYGLLRSIFKERPDLKSKPVILNQSLRTPFLKKLADGWQSFLREPVALVVVAYAVLWLSALSPHGVLLTAFLKDGWVLPDWQIGAFRGAGAVFGLFATLLFPWVTGKFGLKRGSKYFIVFQAMTVLCALACFYMNGLTGQIGFMAFVLFSRIGVYGFGLGEMQIRQLGISPENRGEANGFASALTGVATLGLYGSGALLPTTHDFGALVLMSAASVVIATLTYTYWYQRNKGREF